ncbi:flavodoxin domain-containing protein [Thalassotalea sp. LPB0316]|uniref:flavodoxin domain-containing protein n=1 Tax=Thalassotalea sp. LPB0316 TaxID=2769490 RepID=UPI001869269B|nr:flavodoxin domain-containing protein [Thalassotalea sp. LPB0316]QOL26385.1 flavodoxin domain-containing protein [Thalassotalea sp. LPB0316]
MASFQIIVGSMLGGSEYVAEACQEALEALDHQTQLHLSPDLADIPHRNQIWLVCTSTHGAGEYPDNFQPFVDQLTDQEIDLSTTKCLTIGLGDSSYDTFCQAAKNINNLLISKGCTKITEPLLHDMQADIDPEVLSAQWLCDLNDQLS